MEEYLLLLLGAAALLGLLVFLKTRGSSNDASKKNDVAAPADAPAAKEEPSAEKEKLLPMKIFFGSQSGTAETFAVELAEEARLYHFDAEAVDLEDYDPDDLKNEPLAVFLVATFGEGEPTDNAATFYEWITDDEREDDEVKDVPFAVFALGNRQYEFYCSVGIEFDKRLGQMGGLRLLEHGEGDDDGSLEDDYSEWKEKFWTAIKNHFHTGDADKSQAVAFEPAWRVEYFGKFDHDKNNKGREEGDEVDEEQYLQPPEFVNGVDGLAQFNHDKHGTEVAPVVVNRELRQDTSDETSTVHVEVDISEMKLSYTTADNLGIFPRNDFKIACSLAKCFGLNPNTVVRVASTTPKKPLTVQPVASVQDLLLYYLDVTSIARAHLVTHLAQYARDSAERQSMLTAPERKQEWSEDQLSVYEVFEKWPSLDVPFEAFLELCPKIQPRFYTISSSSKVHPESIHSTVILSRTKKQRERVHHGVCSTYMNRLRPGKDKMCVFVRPSSFRLPKDPQAPIIMVGPGTGIAPFRAFLQEAQHMQEQGGQMGAMTLFFGCRYESRDFIYREELMMAKDKGHLSNLHVAFSRDQEKKVYVQDLVKEQGEHIWDQVANKNAHFYVCGGTSMGRSVKDTLKALAQQYGQLSEQEAADFCKKLTDDERYIAELWS